MLVSKVASLLILATAAALPPVRPHADDVSWAKAQNKRKNELTLDQRTECALRYSKSHKEQDLMLLPTLLTLASGKPGTFVEIGAFDGDKYSNTYMLEKCFGWSGLLVEAQPQNYARLLLAGRRRSTLVHSGACDPPGVIRMSMQGGPVAGQIGAMSDSFVKRWGGAGQKQRRGQWGVSGNGVLTTNKSYEVPCKPLRVLMEDAGLSGAHFLSLDVEGAEDKVFDTVSPAAFGLVMVEVDEHDPPKDERVRRRALGGGLRPAQRYKGKTSDEVWLRGDVVEPTPLNGADGYGPRKARWEGKGSCGVAGRGGPPRMEARCVKDYLDLRAEIARALKPTADQQTQMGSLRQT